MTEIIEATCHTRTRLINAAPYPGMAGVYAMGTVAPVEVLVGGAVVFGMPVEHHLRLGGAAAPPLIPIRIPATRSYPSRKDEQRDFWHRLHFRACR